MPPTAAYTTAHTTTTSTATRMTTSVILSAITGGAAADGVITKSRSRFQGKDRPGLQFGLQFHSVLARSTCTTASCRSRLN